MSTIRAADLADRVSESDLNRIEPGIPIVCSDEYDDGAERILWSVGIGDRVVCQFEDDQAPEARQFAADLKALRAQVEARCDLIGGIRDLADFLEQHPDVPTPRVTGNLYYWETDAQDFDAAAHVIHRSGGDIAKGQSAAGKDVLTVKATFGPVSLAFEVLADEMRGADQVETLAEAA